MKSKRGARLCAEAFVYAAMPLFEYLNINVRLIILEFWCVTVYIIYLCV